MKYRSIVISGPVASGTSTAAKALAKKLGLKYHSTGDYFRQYFLDHNIPLYAKEQIPDDVDRKIDEKFTKLAESKKGVVIDSVYAGYFTRNMSHILRVLLTASQDQRTKRAVERTHTHKETAEDVKRRDRAHDLKFRKLYAKENCLNPKFFNLKIDTTNTPEEEVAKKISEEFKKELAV